MKKVPFNRLSKTAKRKKIAEDAISQLKAKTIKAESGYGYVTISKGFYKEHIKEELNEVLSTSVVECTVCGIGALLIGDIMNTDNLTVGEADFVEDIDIIDKLSNYFPRENIKLVEASFEGMVINVSAQYELSELEKAAIKFGKRFRNDNNRVIAILNNIINSEDGLFHP